jgi:hypothetical protein
MIPPGLNQLRADFRPRLVCRKHGRMDSKSVLLIELGISLVGKVYQCS